MFSYYFVKLDTFFKTMGLKSANQKVVEEKVTKQYDNVRTIFRIVNLFGGNGMGW